MVHLCTYLLPSVYPITYFRVSPLCTTKLDTHTISVGQHIIFLSRVLGLGPLALVVATMGGGVTTAVATCMELEELHFSFRHYETDIYPTKHIES
jgi:hypothetical protein